MRPLENLKYTFIGRLEAYDNIKKFIEWEADLQELDYRVDALIEATKKELDEVKQELSGKYINKSFNGVF